MFEEFLEKCYDDAINLKRKFKITEKKPWTALIVVNELYVQIGHYSFLSFNNSYTKEKGRDINNPKDELADILLQLCALTEKLNIKKEFLTNYEIKLNNFQEAVLMLNVLVGQITEAIMETEGFRHNKSREGYFSKEDFIIERISKCFSIIFSIADMENYDMIDEYYSMKRNALEFLINYEEEK